MKSSKKSVFLVCSIGSVLSVLAAQTAPALGNGTGEIADTPSVSPTGFDHTHGDFSNVLKKHVKNGRVDYIGLKQNRAALEDYLAHLASVDKDDFQSFSRNQKLAFYINAYNGFTLKLIVDNHPVKTIREIGGGNDAAWTSPHVKLPNLFGKNTSLRHLEDNIIRARFKDPRIHFALVCAAKGCPPLISRAYTGSKLHGRLTNVTKQFLADKKKNRYEQATFTLHLSKIFKWYQEDFGDRSSIVRFFETYGPKETVADIKAAKKQGANVNLSFLDYDWNLNR